MFEAAANDGTFLMEYNEWCEYFNNLFLCLNFPDAWAGIRFKGAWNEQNCGGTPTKLTKKSIVNKSIKKQMVEWARNPQYLIELKKDADLFISLG